MEEMLWRQGKGANTLGSSQREQVFIDVSCVVVFCMILEPFLVALKHLLYSPGVGFRPVLKVGWIRLYPFPSLGGSVLSLRAAV